ncbi:MAG: excinuclease ABC subunit A, partial [Chloroflexota bacterium]|nr:excinuclease ABC subunit A [Chloroflexota bacterium]
GGEAQRVKLSTELSRRATGRTLYLLDEPTTGLSFQDCDALLNVLHRLVDTGNTVVLIEHHLDLIKNADWLIDLGPGAGDKGGRVIATGTPEQVAEAEASVTGHYLRRVLNGAKVPVGARGKRDG